MDSRSARHQLHFITTCSYGSIYALVGSLGYMYFLIFAEVFADSNRNNTVLEFIRIRVEKKRKIYQ